MKHTIIRLLTIAASICPTTLWAGPANSRPFTVTNSDGTTLTIQLCGDENLHFYATTDGIPVVRQDNGDWQMQPQIADSLTNLWASKSRQRNHRRHQRMSQSRQRRALGQQSSYTGEKKGIVILVNFKDLKMKSDHTPQKFNALFNEEGYSENYHTGSVHDYFYDQSYGAFNLTFDVVGPITVSSNYAYYGANDADGNDTRVATLAAEACRLANAQKSIKWSDYDWDGDGEVDQVYIVYAGYGEHAGAPENTIWPHEWALSEGKYAGDGEGSITLGGCTINTYAMSCELQGSTGSKLCAAGTACHEFSHCLGLPDFYDTSYKGGFGMNAWDIMSSGDSNGRTRWGESPAGFTAYERWFAGWLNFTELTQPCTVTDMPCLQDEPVAYIIYNDNNRNECFILENRQSKKWYSYVGNATGCHGMLITHVDYNQAAWEENTPNVDANHQRMSIVPASGVFGTWAGSTYIMTSQQYRSQLFPGTDGVTVFDDESHATCGGKLFAANTDGTNLLGKPITDIAESEDGLISFKFMGGGTPLSVKTPAAASPQNGDEEGYYTMGGIRVQKPTKAGIYLQKKGGNWQKVIVN